MWKYSLTAAVLGLGWYLVLLVPSMTREWLVNDTIENLIFLIIASVLTALIGRKFINRSVSFGGHLIRALLLPYLGTVLFLTLWNIQVWGKTLLFGGLANWHDTFSLYYMGIIAVTVSLYVVLPYGLFCQFTMQRVSYSN